MKERVSENEVFRDTFRPMEDEVSKQFRILYNEEFREV
jgi:hypothetical protein